MNIDGLDEYLKILGPDPEPLRIKTNASMAAGLAPPEDSPFSPYFSNAIGYFKDVLRCKVLSSMQEKALHQIVQPHGDGWYGKLAIGSSVNFGKTWMGGGIINWYYDCRGPCIVATTAPSQLSVNDLLWKEVRLQRGRADSRWGIGPQDFIGPSAPEMRRAPDWWARGYVAAKGENFKGRHAENMCFIFDESVGLPELYFRMTKTMFKTNTNMLWICFYNPTDTSSIMYQEIIRQDSDWMVMELSSLDHPNILAGLKGEPLPIPAAVSIEQLESAIQDDCEEVSVEDKTAMDFEWPPNTGQWWRPGQNFEGEFLGRWPSSDESAIWSDSLWKAITTPLKWEEVQIETGEIPAIGCDVAYMGAARTAIHVSWGSYSVHHESKGGQDPMVTAGRLIELADEWADRCNKAREKSGMSPITGQHVKINVDDIGIGGGVVSRLRELRYNVHGVAASEKAFNQKRYPNKRSELWFMTRDKAKKGFVKLGLLPWKILVELRKQGVAPLWQLNSAGQREVERKEITEGRIGRSPDDFDGLNLSYYHIEYRDPEILKIQQPQDMKDRFEGYKSERKTVSWRGRTTGRRGLFRK